MQTIKFEEVLKTFQRLEVQQWNSVLNEQITEELKQKIISIIFYHIINSKEDNFSQKYEILNYQEKEHIFTFEAIVHSYGGSMSNSKNITTSIILSIQTPYGQYTFDEVFLYVFSFERNAYEDLKEETEKTIKKLVEKVKKIIETISKITK